MYNKLLTIIAALITTSIFGTNHTITENLLPYYIYAKFTGNDSLGVLAIVSMILVFMGIYIVSLKNN